MSTKNSSHAFAARIGRLPSHVSHWMDGSLFFRAVTGVMDFVRRVCAGSFLVGLISAEYEEERFQNSAFVRLLDKLLNLFPKILTAPSGWPARLSNGLSGSWLLQTACHALDTPVPPPDTSSANRTWTGYVGPVLQWAAAAVPIWGLLAVTAATPFLPTMLLAGMLCVVVLFTLFRYRFVIDLTTACLSVFIIVTLFCGVTSFAPSASLPIALLTSVLMFSYPTVLACCRKRTQIDFFFFAFITAAAFAGLVGFYQYVTKQVDLTWVDVETFNDISFRVYSSFDNPNVYGAYLLLAIPLCAAMVLYAKKPLYKLYALGVTGLLLLNLLLSYSRGCYLALALAAFIFIMLMEKRLVIFFLPALFVLPFVLPPSILNRLSSITNFGESSTAYRLAIWQGTLRVLKDFWITGVGQGMDAYNVVFPFYAFNAIVAPHSHNLFLQVFVETGIVGLLVFLGVLACFVRTMVCFLRRAADWRDKVVAAAILAAAAGFLFQGIFDYVFYNNRVMLTFFLFMGLGSAFVRISPSGPRQERALFFKKALNRAFPLSGSMKGSDHD